MTTKFGIGIVFWKAQVSAKYSCPTSTITLFSEYGGGGGRESTPPQSYKTKEPANSGGTIGYNYPCYVRRRGWMPTGSCLLLNLKEQQKSRRSPFTVF